MQRIDFAPIKRGISFCQNDGGRSRGHCKLQRRRFAQSERAAPVMFGASGMRGCCRDGMALSRGLAAFDK
jgi:hypothetical protein